MVSHLLMYINSIERVQRHFTKRITELREFSYRELISILNLDTFEYRRLSCDLTLYYEIFNNLTLGSPSEYFNVSMPPYSIHSVYHDFNIRKRVKLIHLRTISLIDVSLPGIVFLLSNQNNMSPRLNIILNLLIYRHF